MLSTLDLGLDDLPCEVELQLLNTQGLTKANIVLSGRQEKQICHDGYPESLPNPRRLLGHLMLSQTPVGFELFE